MTSNFVCYFKVAHFERWQNSLETPSRFYENKPNGICRHLSEKASKGKFLGPDKLQNHTNEEKGKEKKKERGGRKEKKRKEQWLHLKKLIGHKRSIWRR